MKLRAIVLVLLLAFLLLFTAANWGAITAPTQVSLLVARVEAPLGLILLTFLVVVTLVFLFLMVYQQAGAILETRRAAKELAAQRALADEAEASRFTELRKHLDVRLDRLHEDVRSPGDSVNARIDKLETALREHIDHAGNTLAAYIGEVDDRVEQLSGGAAASALVTVGCATAGHPPVISPVAGSIWSTRERAYVSTEVVQRAVRESNLVLLGETHDNLEHHRLQRELLGQMLAAGRRPAVVMEQLDREHQPALDAERARSGHSADSVLEAGRFNRRGWQLDGYRPLVELALQYELPLVAANVSRNDARRIVRDPSSAGLPPVDKPVEDALAADIERSHCGERPEPSLLAGMVAAQRARDVAMAQAMQAQAARGAVLIAGGGHVRADRGAPLYMKERPLVIAFVEVDAERHSLKEYLDGQFATAKSFDFVWFTERAARPDPCADKPNLKMPGGSG